MKTTIGIFILLAMIAFTGMVQAQVLQTNAAADLSATTNNPSAGTGPLEPLISFQDVPITTAIESLAREADINYIIDPHLFPSSNPEPTLTFQLKNISARDTLIRILNVRNLALMEDHLTTVARITRAGQAVPVVDASLLGMDVNYSVISTNGIIPLIQFSEVPLQTGLDSLLRQAAVDIRLDPRIADDVTTLSIHWENLTARQAIVAICRNCDLIIVKDATTGEVQIKPRS